MKFLAPRSLGGLLRVCVGCTGFVALFASGNPNEVFISVERAIVHQPSSLADRDAIEALPQGVVVVLVSPAADLEDLADAYASARAGSKSRIKAGSLATILSVGPLLDSPDRVHVRRLMRHGQQLAMEVAYTSVRAEGMQLLRNISWRPLVQVPIELPAGYYELRVVWRAVKSVPEGEPLHLASIEQSTAFQIQSAS